MIRRLLALIATVVVLLGVIATPAAADKPYLLPEGYIEYRINPCTDELHEINFSVMYRHHEHPNSAVRTMVPSTARGITSDGYRLVKATETTVVNRSGRSVSAMMLFRNDDGRMIKLHRTTVWTATTQSYRVLRVNSSCLGPRN